MIESIKTLLGKNEIEFEKLVNKVREDDTDIGYIPLVIGGVGSVSLAEVSISGGFLAGYNTIAAALMPTIGVSVVGACLF